MRTVKAARVHGYGGREAVRVEETTLAEPRAGELKVRVHAAGVNPIDWKIRAGRLRQVMPLPLPFTLGGEFSGVVESVGLYVAGFKVGDEVYGQASIFNGGTGSFAEFAVARAGAVALKPRSLSHAEVCGLPLAGVSALRALTKYLRVSAGQSVLIHGGARGVGGVAVQLARHLGARVAATACAEDVGYVLGLGAERVIDYGNGQFEEILRGLDAGLDAAGADTYAQPFRVQKRGVRLSSVLERPRAEMANDFWLEASAMSTQVTTERLRQLAELIDHGALRVNVERTYPLDQAADALRQLEIESPRGKIVLKMV